MKNILVSLDFQDHTELLVDKAHKLAKAFGSKVWLLHVAAPDPDFVGYEAGPQYIRDFRADDLKKEHKLLENFTCQLNEKGIEADGLLISGATTEIILRESIKLNIDLIIFGRHEHGFFHKMIFGDTSSNIISKSKIPMLIVPLGE